MNIRSRFAILYYQVMSPCILETTTLIRCLAIACLSGCLFVFVACKEPPPPSPKKVEIVREPALLNPKTGEIIASAISYAKENRGKVDDSIRLREPDIVAKAYEEQPVQRIWSNEKEWLHGADSIFAFLDHVERYGLFPTDYHQPHLRLLRQRLTDSAAQTDAALWARAELMLTDAFAHIYRHLKLGRLERDSVSLRKDSTLDISQVLVMLHSVAKGDSTTAQLESLEPKHEGYRLLKAQLPLFLDTMDRRRYTYVHWPKKDTVSYVRELQSRLFEQGYITFNTTVADSLSLSEAMRKAQVDRGLKVDGKPGPQLIGSLNNNGPEQFIRIAINLDRYKLLPEEMPVKYIWVNLPEYRLQFMDSGIQLMESKVIVGQSRTRTPVLNSSVVNLVTMPQWTVPYSIIFNEMLPKIQKSTRYLAKENLMVVDQYDSIIPPDSINWMALNKKNFPYLLKQRQGDDNSLGVIKFNFRNKYDVYLHDTNARTMFNRNNRAMSHGCVRVQRWDSLAKYLTVTDTLKHHPDSVRMLISKGEKKTIVLKERVPIFIRYLTVRADDKGLWFFEDIYAEDKLLRDRYFSAKY
jgi:L,D-transpeptidase YcbB